jgi:uncharacterized protein (DUF58 family)
MPLLKLKRRDQPASDAASASPDGSVQSSGLAVAPPREAEKILQRIDWTIVRRLDGLLQGEYRSLFYGHGLDLAEVREYQPEDDVRYMDWNVTARMQTPHVRQYLEDREITAWLLLDLSGSVDFGTARMTKRDVVIDCAAAMARILTRRGNRVGAVLYSGGVDGVLPAGGGRRQALAIVHLLTQQAALPHAGVTDLTAVLDRAAQTIRRRSLVFVVSDFIAPLGWEPAFHRLSARNEVIAVWVRDPREFDLPDVGPMVLEDAETGEQVYVDTHDRHLRARFHDIAREREANLLRTFKWNGADVLTLNTDGDMLQDLARFALRRRQSKAPVGGHGVGAGNGSATASAGPVDETLLLAGD